MKGLSVRRFECNVAVMNEAACKAKEAADEEEGGTAKNMTALPTGNLWLRSSCFTP